MVVTLNGGTNALVNVGGIYASAGNISNADFLAGRNHFTGVQGVVQRRQARPGVPGHHPPAVE